MQTRIAGMLQVIEITRQHFGTIPTYCTRCGKKTSFKIVRGDGSYTQLCGCGCTLFQFHNADKYHKTAFFTKKFIPAKSYDPTFKNKDELEKIGMKKKELKNGKKVYSLD